MSNNISGDYDSSDAPWNDVDTICTDCGSVMHENDSGIFRNMIWKEYVCLECGNKISEEPDYD